jgi:uridylate kinase
MDAVTADQMGMLATVLNCLFLKDALVRHGAKASVMSAIEMPRVCDVVRQDVAREKLAGGEIVLFAGGLGSPFFTTDTAVVLRAIEIEADTLLLAKSIDGVYTADPLKDPSAKFIKEISYKDAMAANLRVMDMSAFALCADKGLPEVRVFSMDDPDNILKVLSGSEMGTTLHP